MLKSKPATHFITPTLVLTLALALMIAACSSPAEPAGNATDTPAQTATETTTPEPAVRHESPSRSDDDAIPYVNGQGHGADDQPPFTYEQDGLRPDGNHSDEWEEYPEDWAELAAEWANHFLDLADWPHDNGVNLGSMPAGYPNYGIPSPQMITVTGYGTASAAPDTAQLILPLITQGQNMSEAASSLERLHQTAATAHRNAAGDLDADEYRTELTVTGRSLYRSHRNGYEAELNLQLTVTAMTPATTGAELTAVTALLGDAIAKAVDTAASELIYRHSAEQQEELRNMSITAAVNDAYNTAQALGGSMSITLGPAIAAAPPVRNPTGNQQQGYLAEAMHEAETEFTVSYTVQVSYPILFEGIAEASEPGYPMPDQPELPEMPQPEPTEGMPQQ